MCKHIDSLLLVNLVESTGKSLSISKGVLYSYVASIVEHLTIIDDIGDDCQTERDLDALGSYSRPHLLRREEEEKRTGGQGLLAHFNWALTIRPKDFMDASFILLKNEKSTF